MRRMVDSLGRLLEPARAYASSLGENFLRTVWSVSWHAIAPHEPFQLFVERFFW